MTYDNTNRGAAWPNKRRQTQKHPTHTGELNVEGVEYWVSVWEKEPGDNPKAPAFSFSIQKKEPKGTQQNHQPPEEGFDDDNPF